MTASSHTLPQWRPVLPPGFALVMHARPGEARAEAQRLAATHGAATLVCVPRPDIAEFAVILEPEQPLGTARLAHYLGMNALADALASHCPPDLGDIAFGWPGELKFDGSLIGGGRLDWPRDTEENAVPEWLVFSAMIRISARVAFEDDATRIGIAMDEAGFGTLEPADLVSSFAHHLMRGADIWHHEGAAAVTRAWLSRLPPSAGADPVIGPDGDLVEAGRARRLTAELPLASWYDGERAEPWS